MVIKKFLYWLSLFSFVLIFWGCESLNQNIKTERPPVVNSETKNPIDPETNQPVIKDSSFTSSSAPKLGVILGGGGVLTYAHIGLLHELTKHKINIHSIVGMEWGALVAGTFSKTGRAHEVEWQLLKLPHSKFVEKGVFTSSSGGAEVGKFNDFITGIFKNARIESSRIPFACPYLNLKTDKAQMRSKGYFKSVIKACWPHPPQFKVEAVAANLMEIEKSVVFLRNQGAELILYVDVIGNNLLMPAGQRKTDPKAAMMWMQAKNFSTQIRQLGVNEVLALPLSGAHLSSYESMRMMVRMGQIKSRGFVKQFVKKYGY